MMDALALKEIAVFNGRRTDESVAIAHAATTYTDLFDGVVVLKFIVNEESKFES